MRRTRMYRLLIAIWVCVWSWSGTSQALIKDHLKWVSIREGQSYDSSSATTPGYFFVLRLRTDNTVSYAEFTTPAPASQTYTIPATTHATQGDVHTSWKSWNGQYGWEYQAWFSDIAGLVGESLRPCC
jgi:hypothetical protein